MPVKEILNNMLAPLNPEDRGKWNDFINSVDEQVAFFKMILQVTHIP